MEHPPHTHTTEPSQPWHIAHFQFDGNGTEYFRIWIVNTALSILTLGLYWPWARIRTRRYFYSNTTIEDESFEYLGRPVPILIGYLILLAGLIAYNFGGLIHPIISITALTIFFFGWPWLYVKAIRFRAHYSSYRGIRFRFLGGTKESYTINLGLLLLTPFTMGLLWPFVLYKRKKFLFNHLAYGSGKFKFKSEISVFYKIYLIAFAAGIGIYFVAITLGIVFGILMNATGSFDLSIESLNPLKILAMIALGILYFGVLLCFLGLQEYITVETMNHCLNNTSIEDSIKLESNLDLWKLFSIRMSNTLLILITAGLYTPWAVVKRHQYLISCLRINVTEDAIEKLVGQSVSDDIAIGDVGDELFDFDIGF